MNPIVVESPRPVASALAESRPLRVAIAGFGVVGQSVARILHDRPDLAGVLQLTRVFNRDVARKRAGWVADDVEWSDDIADVLTPEVDVLVETAGGIEGPREWIAAALRRGIPVVTANKLLLAHHGAALGELARVHGAALRFEAAVAGGVPVIHAIERGLAGDRLVRIAGVLNGTCNYILSRIAASGAPFEQALADARRLGLAEADPSSDLDGTDAAAKLAVLASVGFGLALSLSDIRRQSIADITPTDVAYAARLGCAIRQVSMLDLRARDELEAFVGPALVPAGSPLARVDGATNLVLVRGVHGGEVMLAGQGAGGAPTAVAVVSDLLAIARGEGRRRAAPLREARAVASPSRPRYVRFVVRDRPGILAAFASAFARQGINVDAVLQEPGHVKSRLPFVMTLEPCVDQPLCAALEALRALDVNEEAPLALPMLTAADDVPC